MVSWTRKDVMKETALRNFLKPKTKEIQTIKLDEYKEKALITFKGEQDADFLKVKLKDDKFWTITELYGVSETREVFVSDLPTCKKEDIFRFFTKKSNVGVTLKNPEVTNFNPEERNCIIRLDTSKDVKELCEKQEKIESFKKKKLKLSVYYADVPEQNEIPVPEPVTIEHIDATKFNYIIEYRKDILKSQFQEQHCTKIQFSSDNSCKVKLQFNCDHKDHRREKMKSWPVNVKKEFDNLLESIRIEERKLDKHKWQAVVDTVKAPDGVMINEDPDHCIIYIVGMAGTDSGVSSVLRDIDTVSETVTIKDSDKIMAFVELDLHTSISKSFNVKVEIDQNAGKVTLTGTDEAVRKAHTDILKKLNEIFLHKYDFPNSAFASVMNTQLMKDIIQVKVNDEVNAGWSIDSKRVVLFTLVQAQLEDLKNKIIGIIATEDICFKGKLESKTKIEAAVKATEKKFNQYVKLSWTMSEDMLTITVVCGSDFFEHVKEDLTHSIPPLLITKEDIAISPYIVKWIMANSMKDQRQNFEKSGVKFNETTETLTVEGTEQGRSNAIHAVRAIAENIQTTWKSVEEEGIDLFMSDKESRKMVETKQQQHNCEFKIATKKEMKDVDIHCIVLLKTGQALFTGTADLTKPRFTVDVIVNPVDKHLQPVTRLANTIFNAGGDAVTNDCKEYIKSHGQLEEGSVYMGCSGALRCQRIIHLVSTTNDEWALGEGVKNVLDEVNKDDNKCILRSVAMPLLGRVSDHKSAEIILETIQRYYKMFPKVREIYFYDLNPKRVRVIQNVMDEVFKERCYHLPVQNIGLGKGSMTVHSKNSKLQRSGSRTLPLPGGKKILIEWGTLSTKKTDVMVNVTKTAPRPSGVINKSLDHAACCNLSDLCEREFKGVANANKGHVDDCVMVQTPTTGSLPCKMVYHVKIADKWDARKGNANLTSYIKTCLKEAVRQKHQSIAFPTIGTADCGYRGDKVALTFITTVGDFMKLNESSTLKEVAIVIYKTDLVVTAAFEHTVETMYSKRPHRLTAAIEDSVQMELEKEGKSQTDAGASSQKQYKITNTLYTIGSKIDLLLRIGNLENSKVDVIVCTTSGFPNLHGAIPNAIMKAGGAAIQNSCTNQYPMGYLGTGVASTGPGKLNCKNIYYIELKEYASAKDLKVIYESVTKCLKQAENDKLSSIAFPSMGTGGFKFPEKETADQIFKAVKDFFSHGTNYVTRVEVVLFHIPGSTFQTFSQRVTTYFNTKAPAHQQKSTPNKTSDTHPGSGNNSWNVPNSATELKIVFGNLETTKADIIVDTTTSFPTLNGAIPIALCKLAGPELSRECNAYVGKAKDGDIIVTKGYKLQCLEVYHFVLPQWNKDRGQKMIEKCVADCLQKMKQNGHVSIAFPSIGTGGAGYDANIVAEGMYSAVAEFARANRTMKCDVVLVLFPATHSVNKIFTDALEEHSTNNQRPRGGAKKVVHFNTGSNSNSEDKSGSKPTVRSNRDFVLFQFTSNDPNEVELTYTDIKKLIADETREIVIDIKQDRHEDDLDIIKQENVQKKIKHFGEGYNIKVTIDISKRKILMKGIGDRLVKCQNRILNYIHELKEQEQQRKVGNIAFKYLEWCYTEGDGLVWVPYPKRIAFLLEDAHAQGVQTVEFMDTDNEYYVVDFNKMRESLKKDHKNYVSVVRKDLVTGELQNLPDSWQPMEDLDNVLEVVLKPTEQEYKDVKASFTKTLKSFKLNQIKEIRRIQNQTLYQLYHTKKQQMETACKAHGIKNVERSLWHGVKESAEKLITNNGFNRSYSGATFGGKVHYGHGVYFAVNPEYSTDDRYSEPDAGGWKRMYLVKVLTGNIVAVQKWYDERFAPLIAPSQTERYNSVCDNVSNPTEIVIFSDTQAYPEYIILFK